MNGADLLWVTWQAAPIKRITRSEWSNWVIDTAFRGPMVSGREKRPDTNE